MKANFYRISFVIVVIGTFGLFLIPSAFAVVVNGSFTGAVSDTLTRGDAVLPGNIQVGDAVKVTFSYDTNTTSDSWPDDSEIAVYNIYNPISPNNWMQLEVNGLIWRSADEFNILIYNDYTGNPSYILDRFYMGFGDAGSIVFPGYLGQGEIWYYIGAHYNPTDTDTPFLTSLSLPTSLNDINLDEIGKDSGSSVSSRNGENVWLFRFNVDFSTYTLSPVSELTIDDILTFFDESVSDKTLIGYGHGNSANGRLSALRNMLETVSDLIDIGDIDGACVHLDIASDKCDGNTPPPDFVTGDSATTLHDMILDLMAELGCE